MDTRIRKHLERARRVAEFSRQYPSTLPGYAPAVAKLEERLTRATVVAEQETGNRLLGRAAVAKRAALRGTLTTDLQLMAAIARTAGTESVGTPIVIRYPGPQRNQLQFVNGARMAVAKAVEEMGLLEKYGLTTEHLAAITAGLDQFSRLISERDLASRDHVANRLELRTLVRELKIVVDQLHAFNRHRFQSDLAAMGAWSTTRGIREVSRKSPPQVAAAAALLALPPSPNEARAAA